MSLGEINCLEKAHECMQTYKYNVYTRNICSPVKKIGVTEWDTRVIRTSIPTFVFVHEIPDKFTTGISELPLHTTEVPLD